MPPAAGGGGPGAGIPARSCWVAARSWRWRREPVPVALRASEHPGRAGRCPGGAVSDRDGVVSVSGGGGEAGVAAAVGALRVRGGGGLLAVAGVSRLSGGALCRPGGGAAGSARSGRRGVAVVFARARGAPARAAVVCAGGVSGGVAGAGAPAGAVARDGHGAAAAGGAVRGGGGPADRRRGDRGADRRRGARLSSRRGRVAGAAGDDPGDPVAV